MNRARVCFVGGTRYSNPLDSTRKKKFRVLSSEGELFVIGFSRDLRLKRFTDHAYFYLLPGFPLSFLRYAEIMVFGPVIGCWLIFRHRIDVLVAQSPYEGFAAAVTKKISSWFGRPVFLIVESHGDFEKSIFLHRRIGFPAVYRFLMRHAARFSLSHADFLRAISNSTRRQLERWAPGKRIIQFPAWTDIEVFLQAGVTHRERYFQDVLYTGALTPLKGVHHLINAFAGITTDFPGARLIIVGREQNKLYSAKLKDQVGLLGLNGCVEFISEVPQVELATRMRRACTFVLPSLSEGLGRVVIEAMAIGTCVIGSNVGGIPELVEDGDRGFLVPPGDEAALAEKILWILQHPDEAEAMGRRARMFAERFFSTDAYVQGYARLFEHALKTESIAI